MVTRNTFKSEVILRPEAVSHCQFVRFCKYTPDFATLLGAPLSTGPALDSALSSLHYDLKCAVDRHPLMSLHDALVLLKNRLGGPKLQHVTRSTPCCNNRSSNRLITCCGPRCQRCLMSAYRTTNGSRPVFQSAPAVRGLAACHSLHRLIYGFCCWQADTSDTHYT